MTEEKLPNKCDICGLRQKCPLDDDDTFKTIHLLSDKEIIPKKIPRHIYGYSGCDEPNRFEFCLISHPSWDANEKRCDAWQLAVKDLRKGDFLAINLASKSATSAMETERLTTEIKDMTLEIRDMTKKMKLLTWAIGIFTVLQLLISLKSEIRGLILLLL